MENAHETPAAPAKRWIAATTVLPATGAVVVAGLAAWAAFANTPQSAPAVWEQIPASQPYALVPPTPVVPASAGRVKLPPMVSSAVSRTVTLSIDPPPLGGNYGSDAQVEDAFSPAFFSVRAGTAVRVVVYNYDTASHTFTSPSLGLNEWINGGGDHPSKTTFTFTAGSPGNDVWFCAVPCDSYSMSTPGYMEGEIHVVG